MSSSLEGQQRAICPLTSSSWWPWWVSTLGFPSGMFSEGWCQTWASHGSPKGQVHLCFPCRKTRWRSALASALGPQLLCPSQALFSLAVTWEVTRAVADAELSGGYHRWDHPYPEDTRVKPAFGLGCCAVRTRRCWAKLAGVKWWLGAEGMGLLVPSWLPRVRQLHASPAANPSSGEAVPAAGLWVGFWKSYGCELIKLEEEVAPL